LENPVEKRFDHELRRQMLAYAERYDVETGLLGYQAFQDSTSGLLLNAAAAGQRVAVAWIEVMNLRREFALWGWAGADALVSHVARTLREVAGQEALVGRFNGRCFVMAMTVAGSEAAGRQHIQAIADALTQVRGRNARVAVEVEAGVAFCPGDTRSAEELLRFACLAAIHAGLTKSSAVVPFDAAMSDMLIRDHEMEMELHKALDHGRLALSYQPKIDLATGEILGAEALLRWNHPAWGPVPPSDFIPIAERSGLIHRIFDFCLRTALSDVRRWRDLGLPLGGIAVNASAANLRHDQFAAFVADTLGEIPIAPTELEIEVTESLLLEEKNLFERRLRELKEIGVRVAIDDFGTRYTGFEILNQLPLDSMKIDKCFVSGIDRSPDLRSLCKTIVAMARQLGMRTVAEGLEEPGELGVMQEIGCDEGQGFLFQRPLPAEQFTAFLREWPGRMRAFGFVAPGELDERVG
jgi:predicted signal transduction protein with EAL and GGDEF domain